MATKKSSREFLARQGMDSTEQRGTGRLTTGDLKSTRRPYVAPKEIEGAKQAGDRGSTSL